MLARPASTSRETRRASLAWLFPRDTNRIRLQAKALAQAHGRLGRRHPAGGRHRVRGRRAGGVPPRGDALARPCARGALARPARSGGTRGPARLPLSPRRGARPRQDASGLALGCAWGRALRGLGYDEFQRGLAPVGSAAHLVLGHPGTPGGDHLGNGHGPTRSCSSTKSTKGASHRMGPEARAWECPFLVTSWMNWLLVTNDMRSLPATLLSQLRVLAVRAPTRSECLAFARRELERRGLGEGGRGRGDGVASPPLLRGRRAAEPAACAAPCGRPRRAGRDGRGAAPIQDPEDRKRSCRGACCICT